MFGGIPEHLLPTMKDLCNSHGSTSDSTPGDIYYLPSLSRLRFDINGKPDLLSQVLNDYYDTTIT